MRCTMVANYHCNHTECDPVNIRERQFWRDLSTNRELSDLLERLADLEVQRSLWLGHQYYSTGT